MPHKIIRTVAGVHAGALVIVGLWYIAVGLAWVTAPSKGLDAGISWVPAGWVTQDSVGWMWVMSGAVALLCGLFSKGHPLRETIGYLSAVFLPAMVLLWFGIAMYLGRPVTGFVGITMIAGPLAFVAWVGIRAKDPQALQTREVA